MKSHFLMAFVFVVSLSSGAAFAQLPPVIGEFRSLIVADDDTATTPNFFVFPDAINLNGAAVDPDNTVTPENIIWSFSTNATAHPLVYELNGTTALNAPGQIYLPTNPFERRLAVPGRDDPAQCDNDVRTLTVRNRILSPISGPSSGQPATDGILPEYTRRITLFASDGTMTSEKSFLVYTEKGGVDRYTGPVFRGPQLFQPLAGASAWQSINYTGSTLTSSPALGVCISTELPTPGIGQWQSNFAALQLVKDSVYRIRIDVRSSENLPVGTTPLWDFIIDNARLNGGSSVTGAQHKYSMDWINWDTHGGANSVGQVGNGRRQFQIWWAPLPLAAEDWNDPVNGEFAAANDAFNDGRFIFRVLDVEGTVDGNNDAGNLCLRSYQVDRFDVQDFAVVETPFNANAPIAELQNNIPGHQNSSSNFTVRRLFSDSTVVSNDDGITVTPAQRGVAWVPELPPLRPGSWQIEVIDISPGDDSIDFESPSTISDNWPIPWESNELYRIQAGIQAPDQLGESNPPDLIGISMDAPTSELSMTSMISAGANLLGLPKLASQTDYVAYFHGSNRTNASIPQFQRLRPRIQLLNVPQILSGGTTVNNGGVVLKYLKVEKLQPLE